MTYGRTIAWFLGQEEIPLNTSTRNNFLTIDYFTKMSGAETIRSIHLSGGERPRSTDDTYTICSRLGVMDWPERIYKMGKHDPSLEHIGDVLADARKRNDFLLVIGSDGSCCVYNALLAAKLIFSRRTRVCLDAVHFDNEMPGNRKSILDYAECIPVLGAIGLMGGV